MGGRLTVAILETDDVAVGKRKAVGEGVEELGHLHLLVHKDALDLPAISSREHKHLQINSKSVSN